MDLSLHKVSHHWRILQVVQTLPLPDGTSLAAVGIGGNVGAGVSTEKTDGATSMVTDTGDGATSITEPQEREQRQHDHGDHTGMCITVKILVSDHSNFTISLQ